MTQRSRGLVLLVVQVALVLSIAGKYVYERKVYPRVWVRTVQVDPELPFRGRYLALRLAVDSCSLPRGTANKEMVYGGSNVAAWHWTVRPVAREGRLVAEEAPAGTRPELTQELRLLPGQPCERAALSESTDYFIGDRAKSPFPLKSGEELWVEVTVPPVGPPRPIQLAVSGMDGFKTLVVR
jgi:hypothetical protein